MHLPMRGPALTEFLHPVDRDNSQSKGFERGLARMNRYVGRNPHFLDELEVFFVTIGAMSACAKSSPGSEGYIPLTINLNHHQEETFLVSETLSETLFAHASCAQILDLFCQALNLLAMALLYCLGMYDQRVVCGLLLCRNLLCKTVDFLVVTLL
ncbi:hypothetical protein K505DRAFT_36276 [Melanomma pulvis-pyrius CBS 109.77]|uniref:Uncharacterized protein n=1 Tax=Melanomma pulvis-pyrius CBS 109.77 TaxID=1314802 RepID=A0A6A6XBA9_9PLEO|nr:hypothetical protein K505DRAFT_36276 [Melanomma pulvis-pyrius CBS 109.77]